MNDWLPFLRHLLGMRDAHALAHSEHVEGLASRLARKVGMESQAQIERLEFAAEIHDIGKIAVGDFLLNKPGRYTEAEHLMIQQHTIIGAKIVKNLPLDTDYISQIILHHHENFDGTGYPHGRKGDEIPLEARIIRITDTYDALTTNRGYRAAYAPKEAIRIMDNEASFFDPHLLEEFFRMIPAN